MRLMGKHVVCIVQDHVGLDFRMYSEPCLNLVSSRAVWQIWRPINDAGNPVLAHGAFPVSKKSPSRGKHDACISFLPQLGKATCERSVNADEAAPSLGCLAGIENAVDIKKDDFHSRIWHRRS